MAIFTYKALESNGAVVTGEVTAYDRGEALKSLDKKGLQPITVREVAGVANKKEDSKKKGGRTPARGANASKSSGGLFGFGKKEATPTNKDAPSGPLRLKRAEVVLFTEELADMLAAGLQLEPALKAMEQRQQSGNLQMVSERIRQLVRDGGNFSNALKAVSPSFGPLYCSLAAAGEASGALPTILQRQAEYLKTLAELQGRVVLALIYPAFLVLSGFGVGAIFVTKLIPQLTQLLDSTPGAKIPLGARILIGLSDFLKVYWWIFLVIFAVGGLAFKIWKDVESNKPTWDRIKLRLPLYGRVVEGRFFVQFLETMANLVGNGLPLLRSLELTQDAVQNIHLQAAMEVMIDEVGDGRALSSAMIRTDIFPPLLIDMVSVGEQTGKIDAALRRAADRYDKELDGALQRIMALLMPAVLVVMALLIGTMAYLMVTAIFQTISNLNKG